MPVLDHTEHGFETLIVEHLTTAGGWQQGNPNDYDRALGLLPGELIGFVRDTQGKEWDKLVMHSGGEGQAAEALAKRVADQLTTRGTVDVLRKGVTEKSLRFRLAHFRPNLQVDARGVQLYDANRLTVVRQVHHDAKRPADSIDLVLFVNGLPTATCELKNKYSSTGWDVDDAIRQYREDRDPKNILLGQRALVHFALDSELAYMSTRLAGQGTRFLPFNQGSGGPGRKGGKGNPITGVDGHPTAYVWEQVWERDTWMELLDDFVFTEQPAGRKAARTIVFPRYHQWDVVRACSAHSRVHGPGENYLIQHSAGSGKTKEIAWLAHDLSTLHRDDQKLVFDKVIVITDRRVLDDQLQRQVRAFAQTQSAVVEIDEDSDQLREALTDRTAKIIITTLQKFPFVLKKLNDDERAGMRDRSYAVIVDEAHSSQSGDAATDLKQVVGARSIEDLDLDPEERDGIPLELLAQMAARGRQPNISYFAFTATPKGRTLELFGTPTGAADEPYVPFHVYSMRQAIEEGFILDVLRNYTTYQQLFKLEAQAETELPKGKALSKIAAYAKFHPYAKDQKAAVVVDHYKRVVRPQLAGQAKAMVVCASRQEAVRWKQALDRHVEKRGIDDVRILVAFSGEVEIKDPTAPDFETTYRESAMNSYPVGKPLADNLLPGEFDKHQYGILVVAEKYQTGFDQPKLVAMYVDKVLTGVNAVQTLSRLNRVHPDKDETYVLDFVNDADNILAAFSDYYTQTEALPSDPNLIEDAAQTIRNWDVIEPDEVDAFTTIYSAEASHHDLSAKSKTSYAAALELDGDDRRTFRSDLDRYVRFYKFLSQVVPYLAPEHEKLFQFARFLALRLQTHAEGGVSVAEEIELTHYRLVEEGEHDLRLADQDEPGPISSITGTGAGPAGGAQIDLGQLGQLVALFNERFGSELSDTDAVRPVQQLIEKAAEIGEAQGLSAQAQDNTFEDFERGKEDVFINATLQVKDVNDLILQKVLDDDDVREQMTSLVMRSLYEQYNQDRESP